MVFGALKECCLCGCTCMDELKYNSKINNFMCFDCSDFIDEDYINDLCEQADYFGMESLTENEQYILNHKEDLLIE